MDETPQVATQLNERDKAKQAKETVQIPVKSVPAGVKVISVLYYISFASALFMGIFLLVVAPLFLSNLEAQVSADFGTLSSITEIGNISLIFGIVALVMSVLIFFIARGLWNGKNWARILVIVFSVIGLIGAVMTFGIINIILNGIIVGYLLFNKGVKEAFTNQTPAQ